MRNPVVKVHRTAIFVGMAAARGAKVQRTEISVARA
jgi:hypothetical protein